MATYKITLFFERGKYGWTETYYKTTSVPADQVTNTPGAFDNACVAFRSSSVTWTYTRAEDVDSPRKFFLQRINKTGALEDKPDIPAATALITLRTTDGDQRPLYLRGIPDSLVEFSLTGQPSFSPTLRGLIGNYVNRIAVEQFAMKKLQPATGIYQWRPVVGFQQAISANYTQFTIGTTDPNWTSEDLIYFKGIPQKTLPGLKGQFVPYLQGDAGSGQYRILFTWRWTSQIFQTPSAFVRKVGYTYPVIQHADWSFRDYISRDTGRPTGLRRGRSRGISFRR